MSDEEHREAHRMFWLVKGHFDTSEQTILDSAPGYLKRLWNNNERAIYGMDGFEEAYLKRYQNQ